MPVYEYRCHTCGPFDHQRDMAQATAPLPCPTCSDAARRVYSVPAVRSRAGLVGAASASDRARIDRARSGALARTGPPPDGGSRPRRTRTDGRPPGPYESHHGVLARRDSGVSLDESLRDVTSGPAEQEPTSRSTVQALWRYPVKSMLGEELSRMRIDANGVVGDRGHAVVDEQTGAVASAKQPRLWRALLTAAAQGGGDVALTIVLPGQPAISGTGSDVHDRLSRFLGRPVSLSSEPVAGTDWSVPVFADTGLCCL